ncbi:hypothetical protein L3i22_035140 [Actinoplanes sp. L3-i22]|nr:hypothetical protein L3i22_035140 [Actinoplanes sp. L3-i22]
MLLLVAALGVSGTLLAATALRRGEHRFGERAADQQAASAAQAISDGVRRYSDYLTGLAAAVGAQQQLEAAEFEAITAPVGRRMLAGVAGVAYVVPVTTAEIPRVQQYWRDRGAHGLTLRSAPASDTHHLFIILGRSPETIPTPLGVDLSTVSAARAAMRTSEAAREVVISAAYQLRKDLVLPPADRRAGFVLAVPVHATAPSADAGHLRGWLLLGMRGGEFLAGAVGHVAGRAASVGLSDDGQPIARWRPDVPADPRLAVRTLPIVVPGRTWQLTVRPTVQLIDRRGARASLVALAVGAVFTLLLTALTASIATSRDRARRRVEVATAALHADIRHREAVEQQLRRREAELVGFAGVIAHDLRNPLARIAGYTDFLREEATRYLESEHRDYLERVYTCGQQMTVLIDDLLDYATADNRPLRARPVDLHALVEQVARDRGEAPHGRTALVTVGPLPSVDGDPTLLHQLFDNLIGNAIKYTAPDRTPKVRVSGRPEGDDRWRIEVSDNGIGIPERQREAVFDAFTRADGSEGFPGTGLGLAIVHRIVERHHGTIGVDAAAEGGSCFWIVLPATGVRPAPAVAGHGSAVT